MMWSQQERAAKALEQRVRRKAKSVGLAAIKSRQGVDSVDNVGGSMILDKNLGICEAPEDEGNSVKRTVNGKKAKVAGYFKQGAQGLTAPRPDFVWTFEGNAFHPIPSNAKVVCKFS